MTNGETSLAMIERAAFMLAEADTVQKCKELKSLALTAADWARRKGLGENAIKHARSYAVQAEIRMGEMLRETERAPAGRPAKKIGDGVLPISEAPTLAELGLTKRESSEAQLLASAPKERQQAIVNGKKTRHEVVREQLRQKRLAAEDWERRKHLTKLAKLQVDGIHLADFREIAKGIPDNSIDLIFTDPPYNRASLPLYGDLAEIAAAKLAPGGSLIAYAGGVYTPDVLAHLGAHLRFHWQLCAMHSGHGSHMRRHGVIVKWKSLWWFTRDRRKDKNGYQFVEDLVMSEQQKGAHPWQQSTVEASYYISKLVLPGGLVFDPFCGSGTTFAACQKLGRKCITCDIDPDAIAEAMGRCA